MAVQAEVSVSSLKIVGWRNMYKYLVANGYQGAMSTIKVCEEAEKRGFRISHSLSLIFQQR